MSISQRNSNGADGADGVSWVPTWTVIWFDVSESWFEEICTSDIPLRVLSHNTINHGFDFPVLMFMAWLKVIKLNIKFRENNQQHNDIAIERLITTENNEIDDLFNVL